MGEGYPPPRGGGGPPPLGEGCHPPLGEGDPPPVGEGYRLPLGEGDPPPLGEGYPPQLRVGFWGPPVPGPGEEMGRPSPREREPQVASVDGGQVAGPLGRKATGSGLGGEVDEWAVGRQLVSGRDGRRVEEEKTPVACSMGQGRSEAPQPQGARAGWQGAAALSQARGMAGGEQPRARQVAPESQ